MEIKYRRQQPPSRLERLLAQLARGNGRPRHVDRFLVDLVLDAEADLRQA